MSPELPAFAVRADLVVVGAGIVGLAHAWHAARAGLRVLVVERDERAVGASIRNFGHICATAQDGIALTYAEAAREVWLEAGHAAGFPVQTHGTVVLARTRAELDVLEEFAADREGTVRLLTPAQAGERAGFSAPDVIGAAHLPRDLRVDSPIAIPALTAYLESIGVAFRFGENVVEIGEAYVRTATAEIVADRIVVCVGHDVDRLFPVLAGEHDVRRCRLRMLEIEPPRGIRIDPGIFTGTSLLRYGGFAHTAGADAVRAELAPALLEHTVNVMCTQRTNGRIVIGDTHHYERTLDPFDDEELDELLLAEFARLFDAAELTVRRRWRGVYASAPEPYLVATPHPGVVVASVTSGIGMTTAFGFAAATFAAHLLPLHTT